MSEITASDGPSLRPSSPALQGTSDIEMGDMRADIDTIVSEPLDAGNDQAVDAMKRLFQRQMRHKIRQFLDFGQEEADIIKAAAEAAEELVSDEMTSRGIRKMKITRGQLKKLIKEEKDLSEIRLIFEELVDKNYKRITDLSTLNEIEIDLPGVHIKTEWEKWGSTSWNFFDDDGLCCSYSFNTCRMAGDGSSTSTGTSSYCCQPRGAGDSCWHSSQIQTHKKNHGVDI